MSARNEALKQTPPFPKSRMFSGRRSVRRRVRANRAKLSTRTADAELLLSHRAAPCLLSALPGSSPSRRSSPLLRHATFARHASSDVIAINANHTGFTACLLYGAVGRVAPGPSTRSAAGGVRRWARGFGGCWPSPGSTQQNRGSVVGFRANSNASCLLKSC